MSTVPPLPPYTIHSTNRLTHSQAHTQLSTFLSAAQNDAAYRPDSVLTDRGPQSASATGANLVLVQLERIRRGIAGERIGGANGEGVGLGVGVRDGRGRKRRFDEQNEEEQLQGEENGGEGYDAGDETVLRTVEEPTDEGRGKEVALEVQDEGDGWVDKDDYELAQEDRGDEGFRVDETQPGAVDVHEQPGSPAEARAQMKVKSESDKAARKARKKEKRKSEKMEKEALKIAR